MRKQGEQSCDSDQRHNYSPDLFYLETWKDWVASLSEEKSVIGTLRSDLDMYAIMGDLQSLRHARQDFHADKFSR